MLNPLKLGNFLKIAGIALLSSIFTLSAGYYIGDKGMRWFPDTWYLLLMCLFLGICCLLGSTFIAGPLRTTEKGKRLKKRVFVLSLMMPGICLILFVGCQLQKRTPLTALDHGDLETAIAAHLELLETYDKEMESLLGQMHTHPALERTENRPLSLSEETFLRDAWLGLYEYAFGIDQIREFYRDWYRFDISRSQRPRHVQSFLLQYAADVILYDKALRAIDLLKQNPNAVKLLNAPHPESGLGANSFSRFQLDLFGADCHTRIYSSRLYAEWLRHGLNADSAAWSGPCLGLWETAETRLAILDKMDVIDRSRILLDADLELIRQGASRTWFPLQKGVAEWMGDTRLHRVGKYLIDPPLREALNDRLQPGDILLSRKNWYLSNVGLPGFWPHAILYIGQPEKLAAYFDDPAVTAYLTTLTGENITFAQYMNSRFAQKWLQYQAGNGKTDYHVIEAIKYGVLLNPLEKACGDYLAAVRPKLDKVAKAQAVIQAFAHLDKPYDFDFDFATDHALVCTELVWRSYQPDTHKQGLRFDLVEIAGRKTLPANEIAKCYVQGAENGNCQFEFVCFIDAAEKEQKAYFAAEADFIESVKRAKWSFLQE